jgi:hypothetical protein
MSGAKVKRTKSTASSTGRTVPLAQPQPMLLADSLPRARSVAQTLAGDPMVSLADSLPKAPPRVKDTPVLMPERAPVARSVSRASAHTPARSPSRASSYLPLAVPVALASSEASPDSTPEPSTVAEPRQPPSRSQSVSGASFSNEPFTFKRSRLEGRDTSAPFSGLVEVPASSSSATSPDQTRSSSPVFDAPERHSHDALRHMISTPELESSARASDPMRGRARSLFSESAVSTGGRSTFARSVMSVPSGAYRPARNPARVNVFGSETLTTAEPTMCAVAIASNASTSLTKSRFSTSSRAKARSPAPAHLAARYGLGSHVDFSEIASPPKKLGTTEVLVQVFAVGVDLWDRARVDTLVERGDGYGYIPGRSFCGKAIECGVDVSRVHKGDFVYGLGDLRKVRGAFLTAQAGAHH